MVKYDFTANTRSLERKKKSVACNIKISPTQMKVMLIGLETFFSISLFKIYDLILKFLIIGPEFFFTTGPAAQTAQKQKSCTIKKPLMQDRVFRLGTIQISGPLYLISFIRILPNPHRNETCHIADTDLLNTHC